MNAANAASRMRSRTAASSPPSWRFFAIEVLFIRLLDGSGTEWYHFRYGTQWYHIKENQEDTTMKFMIALLMAVFPALSFAQSQPEAGQSLPARAIPKTTAVLVI